MDTITAEKGRRKNWREKGKFFWTCRRTTLNGGLWKEKLKNQTRAAKKNGEKEEKLRNLVEGEICKKKKELLVSALKRMPDGGCEERGKRGRI